MTSANRLHPNWAEERPRLRRQCSSGYTGESGFISHSIFSPALSLATSRS
jgi:hypothetical protein